jgi:hypothetical protein
MQPNPSKKGRKGKLTPDLIDAICKTLAETGSDRISYETHNVSQKSFYEWQNTNSEFKERIEKARQDFYKKGVDSASDNVKLAEDYISQVLSGTYFKKKIKQVLDKTNEIRVLEELEQVVPSDALLERVLGRSSSDPNPTFVFKIGEPDPIADRTPGDEEEILKSLNLESDGNADLS